MAPVPDRNINRRLASGHLSEAQLLGMLRGTRRTRLFVSELRGNIKPDQLEQISKIIALHPLFGLNALGNSVPQDHFTNKTADSIRAHRLHNEIIWVSGRIEVCAQRLARFLQMREVLGREFLLGNDPAAFRSRIGT